MPDATEISLTASPAKVIKQAYIDGSLEMGESDQITWNGFMLEGEPWKTECFSKAEMKEARRWSPPNVYLYDLAIRKSKAAVKRNGWEGMVYLYPSECNTDFGQTIYYRKLR